MIGNIVSGLDVDGLRNLMDKIRETGELVEDEDAQNELATIEAELEHSHPRPKILRRSFLLLKGLATEIGASVAAQYIASALGLL